MSVRFRPNWNLEVLVFKAMEKPEYPEKNLSKQGREPTTNSTHIWRRRQDSNPAHIGGRRLLSPLHHPCTPRDLTLKITRRRISIAIIPTRLFCEMQAESSGGEFLRTVSKFGKRKKILSSLVHVLHKT